MRLEKNKMSWFEIFIRSLGAQLIDRLRPGGRSIVGGIEEILDFGGIFEINILGFHFSVTKAVFNIVVTVAVIGVLCLILSILFKKRDQERKLVETGMKMLIDFAKSQGLNDEQAEAFSPFILALFIYIAMSCLLSVFSIEPAAVNPAFPLTMGFFTILCLVIWGIRFIGPKRFLKSLVAPQAFMLPFNILDYVIKPTSLGFRLLGNILGASVLIAFLKSVMPLFLPQLLGLWFDVGDAFIQATVFCYLSLTYIGEIVEKGSSHHVEELSTREPAQ